MYARFATQGVSGTVVQKGEAATGDLKLNKQFGDQTVDVELTHDAKVKVNVTVANLIPNGGKIAVGGTMQDLETIKVSSSIVTGPLGIKADVVNYAAPKADASVCYALGSGFAVGAMATVKGSAPLAYTIALQSKQGDVTYAATIADQLKTYKLSAVQALDSKRSAGVEVVYKKTATATVGFSQKMDGHSFKIVATNPVSAEVNPTVCVSASLSNLIPKTTATFAAQVDKSVRRIFFLVFLVRRRPCFANHRTINVWMSAAGVPTSIRLEDGARAIGARRAINSCDISLARLVDDD